MARIDGAVQLASEVNPRSSGRSSLLLGSNGP